MSGTLASPATEVAPKPGPGPREAVVTPAQRRRARRTLLLLAFVCVLPVVASYLAFYVWQPQGRVNHGELLTPTPLPASALAGAGGQPPLARAELEGRWTLVVAAPAACDAACRGALYVSRQARLAQAKEMERVARLWLVTDAGADPRLMPAVGSGTVAAAGPEAGAGAAAGSGAADGVSEGVPAVEELRLARADAAWLAAFPGAAVPGTLFLVDPLGNVMMRFAPQADTTAAARGMTKDLQRLLKYSALGRGGQG